MTDTLMGAIHQLTTNCANYYIILTATVFLKEFSPDNLSIT